MRELAGRKLGGRCQPIGVSFGRELSNAGSAFAGLGIWGGEYVRIGHKQVHAQKGRQ